MCCVPPSKSSDTLLCAVSTPTQAISKTPLSACCVHLPMYPVVRRTPNLAISKAQYQRLSEQTTISMLCPHLSTASSPWLASPHCNTTHTDVQLWSQCSSWISAFRVISHWFYFLNCCTLITGCQVRFLCGAIISVWGYGHFSWSRNNLFKCKL